MPNLEFRRPKTTSGIPNTEVGLEKAGYAYENTSNCRGCGAEIAWYLCPSGRPIALDEGTLEPHSKDCAHHEPEDR